MAIHHDDDSGSSSAAPRSSVGDAGRRGGRGSVRLAEASGAGGGGTGALLPKVDSTTTTASDGGDDDDGSDEEDPADWGFRGATSGHRSCPPCKWYDAAKFGMLLHLGLFTFGVGVGQYAKQTEAPRSEESEPASRAPSE
jgi:hypothetical protein